MSVLAPYLRRKCAPRWSVWTFAGGFAGPWSVANPVAGRLMVIVGPPFAASGPRPGTQSLLIGKQLALPPPMILLLPLQLPDSPFSTLFGVFWTMIVATALRYIYPL